MATDFDRSIEIEARGKPCPGKPCSAVGQTLRRAEPVDREEQYRRDLEVIERCEQQIEHQAGCPDFFGCMGALAAGRVHG